jgi:hypothetical protein
MNYCKFGLASLCLLVVFSSCAREGMHRLNANGSKPLFESSGAENNFTTHKEVVPLPAAPSLPAAGGTYVDPTFGTSILRVTDQNDGNDCGVAYSYWPSFNANSTRLHLRCNGRAILYDFDPYGFRLISKRPLFEGATSDNSVGNPEDSIWSSTNPRLIFTHDLNKLWIYDVESKSYSLGGDIKGLLRDVYHVNDHHIFQMSKSADDNVFAWLEEDSNYSKIGYVVYRRDQNRIIFRSLYMSNLDEVQLDKSGRYLTVKTQDQTAGQIRMYIIDLSNGQSTPVRAGNPELACGHSDNGQGISIGIDNFTNTIQRRSLSDPFSISNILEFGNDWSQSFHVSTLASDESWALISGYLNKGSPATNPGLYHGEIFQVATDGSQRVRRLAHHRSSYNDDYVNSPKANISSDGKFVTYTSNWDGSNIRSVFVLRIEGGGQSTGQPPEFLQPVPVPVQNPTPAPTVAPVQPTPNIGSTMPPSGKVTKPPKRSFWDWLTGKKKPKHK